jgi:hypothetical protein
MSIQETLQEEIKDAQKWLQGEKRNLLTDEILEKELN